MARAKSPKAASSTLAPTLTPPLAEHAAEAFASVKDEILAVPTSELLPTNLDILRAAGRGSVAAERIAPLLPELEKLHGLDFRRIAWLGIYALALVHAHDLATEVGAEALALPALLEEAAPLREDLLRSAELVAHFGVVPAERVAAIRSGHGHFDTAGDLVALGRLFVEIWDRVHGKVFVTRAMVERATVLGGLLNKALAQREIESSPLVPNTDRRHLQAQAFTVFARAYNETRRGVSYLRWHEGDAHLLVPSLYPHRPRRSGVTVHDTASDVAPEPISDAEPEPTPMAESAMAFSIV